MKLMETYFIVGYAVREPYISNKMYEMIRDGFDYEEISKVVTLILIREDGSWKLKHLCYLKDGEYRHASARNSNYFKFAKSIFRCKNKDVAKFLDLQPANFLGYFVSFLVNDKVWVKTPESKKFKPELSESLKNLLFTGFFTEVYLLEGFLL